MVKVSDLKALARAAPGETVARIVCSQPPAAGYLFAVVELAGGGFAAVQDRHGRRFETVEQMLADDSGLNSHERTLLRLGANLS